MPKSAGQCIAWFGIAGSAHSALATLRTAPTSSTTTVAGNENRKPFWGNASVRRTVRWSTDPVEAHSGVALAARRADVAAPAAEVGHAPATSRAHTKVTMLPTLRRSRGSTLPRDPGSLPVDLAIASSHPPPPWSHLGLQADGLYLPAGDSRQRTVTNTGADAIPLATTTRMLGPTGVVFETVKPVDERAPGAIETDVQSLVRA